MIRFDVYGQYQTKTRDHQVLDARTRRAAAECQAVRSASRRAAQDLNLRYTSTGSPLDGDRLGDRWQGGSRADCLHARTKVEIDDIGRPAGGVELIDLIEQGASDIAGAGAGDGVGRQERPTLEKFERRDPLPPAPGCRFARLASERRARSVSSSSTNLWVPNMEASPYVIK